MKQVTSFIFDMDGTLYSFEPGKHVVFSQTQFCRDLEERVAAYVASVLQVDAVRATQIVAEIDRAFNGDLSIGMERVYGIDRYEYYKATWSCDPTDYILPDKQLRAALLPFAGRTVLLTAAPRVWAERVLRHLDVADIFGDRIISGEPDIRKPNARVFEQAAELLGTAPDHVLSVGDQHHTDILPAQSVGMRTLLIGPDQMTADHRADSIYHALTLIKENYL
jgi:FMN phosphatase YigB (HAD superfamily)